MAELNLQDFFKSEKTKREFMRTELEGYFENVLSKNEVYTGLGYVNLSIYEEDGERYTQLAYIKEPHLYIIKVAKDQKNASIEIIRNYLQKDAKAEFELDTNLEHQDIKKIVMGNKTLTFGDSENLNGFISNLLR